jgi:hypothetical protein
MHSVSSLPHSCLTIADSTAAAAASTATAAAADATKSSIVRAVQCVSVGAVQRSISCYHLEPLHSKQ